MVKDHIKLAKEKSREKHKDTNVARCYKKKIWDAVHRGNITINEAPFARALEMTYSMEQTEQLLGKLQLDNSEWLDKYPHQVTVDKVCHGNVIKYIITVNNVPVNMFYDTGTSMSCMAKLFFDMLPINPKVIPCDRYIAGLRVDAM